MLLPTLSNFTLLVLTVYCMMNHDELAMTTTTCINEIRTKLLLRYGASVRVQFILAEPPRKSRREH